MPAQRVSVHIIHLIKRGDLQHDQAIRPKLARKLAAHLISAPLTQRDDILRIKPRRRLIKRAHIQARLLIEQEQDLVLQARGARLRHHHDAELEGLMPRRHQLIAQRLRHQRRGHIGRIIDQLVAAQRLRINEQRGPQERDHGDLPAQRDLGKGALRL